MSTAATHRVYATVTGPTATFVSHDGHHESLVATNDEDIRNAIMRRATDEARRVGAPLELVTAGDRGEHRMMIAADGDISRPLLRAIEPDEDATSDIVPEPREAVPDPEADAARRATFIGAGPALPDSRTGIRWLFTRLGLLSTTTPAETARAAAVRTVSQHWAGCRTIAVVNGKGGVGKTITTAMLAAVYGRYGGGNVLAWDNNDTRGTLGWRTEAGRYDTTIRDLLPQAEGLLARGASISDVSAYVHHQSADRYDVLRSNPELLASHQRIAGAEFDLLMQVAARYYRLVVFDSGNDESAERWLRMVDSSFQLVIPTLTAPESAESAALLLDALRRRDERSHSLATNAVVVVTQSERSSIRDVHHIAARFAPLVRSVAIVPFDPALKSGPIRHDALRPATREAWLQVAAAAASQL
ncbi:MAG TPA: ATPase [Microbacterium sp.]|nr:ATPase [Microbacterium sp.]|tara:strand:- start:2199 stop:3446 length:1248 start_codon:yes stop_codon:yes gene_type:complete